MSSTNEKTKLLVQAFGAGAPSRDGEDMAFRCPKCSKSSGKKKLAINLDKGLFHCWVCGLSGKRIDSLFKKYAPHLLNNLKRIGGWSVSKNRQESSEDLESESILEPPRGFKLLANNISTRDPDLKDTILYCNKRGLSIKDMWYFKLGTCTTGKFRRRVIFPSFTEDGKLNYFTARSIDDDTTMKYINAAVPKKTVIFNDINVNWKKPLVLVEGPFDLTKSVYNSSCLLGSHLPEDSMLFRKIVKNNTPTILALDPDAVSKSHNIAKLLASYGVAVKMAKIPTNKDVGDLSRKIMKKIIKNSTTWQNDDRLRVMISNMKTGSLV